MYQNILLRNIIVICLILSTNLFIISIAENSDNISINNNINEICYGYIIPLPSGKDTTYETFQNSKVRFMINDLLRENIDVFWSLESFTAFSKSFNTNKSLIEFQQGTFIIPFQRNISKDKLITSIIIDFNISSEIDKNNLTIEAYILTEKIEVNTLKLVEPKIAQHFDIPIRYGWPCYLQIAESGGFLNFDFLLENEVLSELNNDKYNVFMWPYKPDPAHLNEVIISLSNKREFEKIRSFVREGGGYIGSCYGAYVATSGLINPLSVFHIIQAYIPTIPFLPFSLTLSMSDSLMMEKVKVLENLYTSYSTINDNSHPVSFGINNTVKEFFSGPWYIWLGKNTNKISTFNKITLDENKTIPKFIKEEVENSPSWIISKFGQGNMVLFASHPEFVNNISLLFENRDWNRDEYYGRRVIFNSIMYTTAKKTGIVNFDIQYPYPFIEEIKKDTINIDIELSTFELFKNFKNTIDEYENNITILRNQSLLNMKQYSKIFNESILYPSESRPLLYTYTYCDIILDYINKIRITLDKINNINYLFCKSNYNISNKIISFKNNISEKMNYTIEIFQKSLNLSDDITILLEESEKKLLNKPLIVEKSRKMITSFETTLKYLPQIYFESLKMLNHEWYNYESRL